MSALQALKKSYTVFGVLLTLEGLSFVLCPHLTTKLLLLSPLETAQAVRYARIAGLGISVVGFYYCVAAYYTMIPFFRIGIIERICMLPGLIALIYFWSIEPSFLIIGVQDLITALWSYSYLKAYDEEQAKLKK